MPKTNPRFSWVWVALVTLVCTFCVGCVAVPIHVRTKAKNVSGKEEARKLDLSFIVIGTTTREEVRQKLDWIDTGVKDERLFLGRWADSSWGVFWGAASYPGAAGGWNRKWNTHNAALDFDEKGVLREMAYFRDSDVLKTLSDRVSRGQLASLDLSTPIEVPVEYMRSNRHFLGTLHLSRDAFAFLEDRATHFKESYDFKTSPGEISHLSLGHWVAADSLHPENVVVSIHFKQRTAVGTKLDARMDVPGALVLIKYVAQTQSGP